jgi:hypothetical protein
MGSQMTGHGTGTRTPLSKGLSLSVPLVSLGQVPQCPAMSHVPWWGWHRWKKGAHPLSYGRTALIYVFGRMPLLPVAVECSLRCGAPFMLTATS